MIKLFTHTDLDGVGCEILGKLAFGEDISIDRCNYGNIDSEVEKFLKNTNKYDKIFITDISVNKEVADELNNISNKVVLLDHHKTALWLNEYPYALVQVEDESVGKMSGTYLFYEYLKKNHEEFNDTHALKLFVDYVRMYDTWEWKEKYNNIIPKRLNDLMYMDGVNEFIDKMTYRLGNNYPIFDDKDILKLDIEQENIDNYVVQKDETLIVKDNLFPKYTVGITFADKYISELGNKLCELHPNLDFVVLINMTSLTVSYRTVKNIDLSAIAKKYGGGGHPKASGSRLNISIINNTLSGIFGGYGWIDCDR